MTTVLRASSVMVLVTMLLSVQGCGKREVKVVPPDQATVEAFLPEQVFRTDTAELPILTTGISELKISEVVTLEKDMGNALVSLVHTSNEGTWRLVGRLIYKINAGKTECQFIEFSEVTPLDAAASARNSEVATAPAE